MDTSPAYIGSQDDERTKPTSDAVHHRPRRYDHRRRALCARPVQRHPFPRDLARPADRDRPAAARRWWPAPLLGWLLSAAAPAATAAASPFLARPGSTAVRQRSITGPLILILIGGAFLIHNLRPELFNWRLIGDYWPFLLIAIGLIGLVEGLFYASRGQT